MPLEPQPTVPNRKLLARRRRTARIRRVIVTGTVALFIALFAAIYVQMASGHDPVLGNTTTVASTTTSSGTSSGSTSSSTSSDDSSSSSTSSNDSSSSTPSAVTTQQS